MKARDRRALLVLLLWIGGLGLYGLGRILFRMRQTFASDRTRLVQLQNRQVQIAAELARVQKERADRMQRLPKDLFALPEDQLRLRGQDGLLSAAQRSGLKDVKLRSEASAPDQPKGLQWTLDAEGPLGAWVDALQAMEASQPLMTLQSIQWNLDGDPWNPETGEAGVGPRLRGSVSCSWTIPQ